MKIALLGGGGFRTPLAYTALQSIAERVRISELVLHDVSPPRLQHMRMVLEGLSNEHSVRLPPLREGPPLRFSTDLDDAVRDADFVWCAVRVGGLEARRVDEEVPLRFGIVGQETTGPGGICFALRSIPVLLDVARTVARLAPRAWFINFTNPVGMVTEALQTVPGVRAIGVCDTPTSLCRRVARLIERSPSELWFDYFGLNHLGWLRAVLDRSEDRLPELLANGPLLSRLPEAQLFGVRRLRELRMIPNEYLYYYDSAPRVVETMRTQGGRAAHLLEQERAFYRATFASAADAVERWRRAWRQREHTYMAEAHVQMEASEPTQGYAEVAADLVEALANNATRVMIVNTTNRGSLPFLDNQCVVEVPCIVGAHGAVPVAIGEVPTPQRELVQRIKLVERLTIEAAIDGSATAAVRALAQHPLVADNTIAQCLFDTYRSEHAKLRAQTGAA